MHVEDGLGGFQHAEQQWGRDVVGQVADQAQARAARGGHGAPVHLQCVGLVQHEPRLIGIAVAQQRRQVAIDFDHFEPSGGSSSRCVSAPWPGPISTAASPGCEVDRRHDARNDRRIVQEMLAETLARAAVGNAQTGSWRDAICAASSIAAIRLPASPRPLPARSSAVP